MALLALVAVPTVVDAATTASRPRATKPTTTTPATTTPTTATTTTPTTTTPTTTTPVVKTPTLHWNKAIRLEPTTVGGLDAVSCAVTGTSQVCVAVDQAGGVITTIHPARGPWSKRATIDRGVALTGVSCPTITFCAAVDANGNVLTSTAPTRGGSAWSKPAKIDATAAPGGGSVGLTGISCPTTTLCVAVDGGAKGSVLVSTSPTAGPHAWIGAAIGTGPLTSVACASSALCVAGGDQHYVSIDPVGGAHAWKGTGTQLGGGVFSAITCQSLALCVGVGYGNTSTGLATATATPKGSAGSWKTVDVAGGPPLPGQGLLDGVGCPSATECVAVDGQDNAYTTSVPVGGAWSAPTPIRPSSAATTSAISCTAAVCVVVDSAGVETSGVVH